MAADTAQNLLELFAGNEAAHGTHGEPDWDVAKNKWSIRRTAKSLRAPATAALWAAHLSGEQPLGVVPVLGDGTVWWGSIDVDEYEGDHAELVKAVYANKLPLVPCRSKSGGLHLFVFLEQPTQASLVMAALRDVAARLGVAGSEIFPKQTRVLADRGDVGSWMVMPYYGGTFDGKLRLQVGVKKTGGDMTVREFIAAATAARLQPQQLENLRSAAAGGSRRKANGNGAAVDPKEPAEPFGDGPPCLQHLARVGVEPGGQNNTLLMMGIYYKRRSPGGWKTLLERANSEYLKPPGSAEGLTGVIKSLERKEYEYLCKTEPMCSHCDSQLCVTRKYGVGDGGNFPRITSISKLDTEPPLWFVDIDDRRLELDTDTLQNYTRFHKVSMERLDRSYNLMSQSAWMKLLNECMRNLTVLPAPVDVGNPEQFRELLEDFLTNRTRGAQREDILLGRPWQDQDSGKHYFRLTDLMRYVTREGMREMTRGRIARQLQRLGGQAEFFNIRGHGTNVWWVPGTVVQATPDVPPPPHKDTPA